ncbi:MAG: hypothetical protein GY822_17145 [Deltaproteobacteria bacterium]|nr:hypothetical protein [Deltaproteobacteria bacterium]
MSKSPSTKNTGIRGQKEPLSASLVEEIITRKGHDRPVWVRLWRKTLQRILPLGGHSSGNSVRLFHDGDAAFSEMLTAIDHAQHRVWLETYIFEDDLLGQKVRAALWRAKNRGVDVRILFDSFGSNGLPSDFFDVLLDAGAKVVAFNPLFPFVFRRASQGRKPNAWTTRDHRKLLVVDDDRAFLGGMNISCDYAGPKFGNGSFRDTHLEVKGPAVIDVANLVLTSMKQTVREEQVHQEHDVVQEHSVGTVVQLLSSNARRGRQQIQRSLRQCVTRSLETCYLTSPYFVPPRRLLWAMSFAARRGVDVRVLTAGRSDVPISKWAGQAVYARLLKKGVRIFELQSATLHAKTASVDGIYSLVGSFNLDSWSYRRNLEVSLGIVEPKIAAELEEQFLEDLKGAREIKLEEVRSHSWHHKARSWVSYQLLR